MVINILENHMLIRNFAFETNANKTNKKACTEV
jgi:hypothetical protein